MFLLMLILLMISPQSDVVFRICLCSCRYYILVFNLHRFPAKWLLHKMLYWKDRSNLRKNCFSLHIARNNPRAEKRRNFTAHNISLCPSLYVWQNHKYFKNKVQVSIKTFEKKKRRKTAKSKHASKRNRQFIKKPFTHANCFPGQQHLKVSLKTTTRILK